MPWEEEVLFERFEARSHAECRFGIWERASPRRCVLQPSNAPAEGSEKSTSSSQELSSRFPFRSRS